MKFVKHGLLCSRLATFVESGNIGKSNFAPRMNNNSIMKNRLDKVCIFLWAVLALDVSLVGTEVGWQCSMPFLQDRFGEEATAKLRGV